MNEHLTNLTSQYTLELQIYLKAEIMACFILILVISKLIYTTKFRSKDVLGILLRSLLQQEKLNPARKVIKI